MRDVIIQMAGFAAAAEDAGLSDEDVRLIELEIMENPAAWPLVPGTGGLRKMRFAPAASSAGKSGGARVCYFVITPANRVYLVTCFAKNERQNLSDADRNAIAKSIARIKRDYLQES